MLNTLKYFPIIYCITLCLFLSCTKKEVNGCTNEFANNYNEFAVIDCCCEFEVESIISGIVGQYVFEDDCSQFSYEYNSSISKMENIQNGILISNFSFNKMDFIATFKNGKFEIDSSFYIAGCQFNFSADLFKKDGELVIESQNKVLQGLCTNISDTNCTAKSN